MLCTLKGSLSFAEMKHIVPLTEEALLGEKQIVASWSQTSHWGEWWTRLPQLQMLTQVFSHHGIPQNTNGVERINQDSKQENPTSLHGTSDKAKALVVIWI